MMMLSPKIDRFPSIARFADNGHVCFASDEGNQAFTDNAVIIRNEDPDQGLFRISNFRHFFGSRLWFLRSFPATRGFFLFGCHEIASPLQGSSTLIFVPLPCELEISNSQPIC